MQGEFGDDGPVGMMVAFLHRRPEQHRPAHDAAVVVTPDAKQQAAEPVRRPRRCRVQPVGVRLEDGAIPVDHRRVRVDEDHLRALVKNLNTAQQQVAMDRSSAAAHLKSSPPACLAQ